MKKRIYFVDFLKTFDIGIIKFWYLDEIENIYINCSYDIFLKTKNGQISFNYNHGLNLILFNKKNEMKHKGGYNCYDKDFIKDFTVYFRKRKLESL